MTEEIGTEAGAVKYHICFPSRLDFFNICDALDVPFKDTRSNPGGGWYGVGAFKETVLVVGCCEGFLGGLVAIAKLRLDVTLTWWALLIMGPAW